MFLDIFIEVVLLTIIIGGSYLGYQKGIFLLLARPIKSVILFPLSYVVYKFINTSKIESLVILFLPEMSSNFAGLFLSIFARAVCVILILLICRIALACGIKLFDHLILDGPIRKFNRALGLVTSGLTSILFAVLIVNITDKLFALDLFINSRLVDEFDGGLLYRLFENLN